MLRLFHTLRYLKPIQVANRITRRFVKPKLWVGEIPAAAAPRCAWQAVATLPTVIVDDNTVCFLNENGPLYEWHNPAKSHLWLYNLHYFDDLLGDNAQQRVATHRDLIVHWLANNPPAKGVGWEPYPTSLRIVNWVQWLLAGNEPVPGMLASLFQQACVLSQQLEYHLQGNHLLANAKALVFAGSYFGGDATYGGEAAEKYLATGLAILDAQHREQVLADGGHFELSPMYHAIILMDVLDLIQLSQCYPGTGLCGYEQALRRIAMAMTGWLQGMLHPDGDIAFFNDAAFGIAPKPTAIIDYARHLGVVCAAPPAATCHYEASGYIALRHFEQVAFLDMAPIGPDTIPGHAHADTLCFEWSLHGQRVLVNSGISEYGLSAERLRQRGTPAHNTVAVNGLDSSEVWSGFRVARRARPFDVGLSETADDTGPNITSLNGTGTACISAGASHTGYHRLRPKVTHTRQWRMTEGALTVTDTMAGRYESAVAYFHIHPLLVVAVLEPGAYRLTLPDGRYCDMCFKGGSAILEDSTWHPEFGVSVPNKRIAVTFENSILETDIRY